MALNDKINRLRTTHKLSQEEFAEIFKVSRQSVQKWENGMAIPEISKIIEISKYFDISLDELVLDRTKRAVEEMEYQPSYTSLHPWEFYAGTLMTEYQQCVDEGLDIERYKDLFTCVSSLPTSEEKKELADTLFKIISKAKIKNDYKYNEPSSLEEIKALRKKLIALPSKTSECMNSKIKGAWYGRIAGCMLGKTVEGIRTDELVPFLKESGNYPMHRYILSTDVTDEVKDKYKYNLKSRPFADKIDRMPADDDTNYTVLYQLVIEKYGKNFTSEDVAKAWMELQPKNAYCTAERIAYCNFIKGYAPPSSAIYQNPYREWIGAQIRADYFGYINPGNPELAAEMAFRDACISHVKNGIYGEMFVAAMLAAAAVTGDIKQIIFAGLSEIPYTSRLFEDIMQVIDGFENGVSQADCFRSIHNKYNEYTSHGWCHTNPNAMIVTASLLYGGGDFGKSICMAVETGFDTDCNGATVGSILGLRGGIECIDKYWIKPFNGKLHTQIIDMGTIIIDELVDKTIKHIG